MDMKDARRLAIAEQIEHYAILSMYVNAGGYAVTDSGKETIQGWTYAAKVLNCIIQSWEQQGLV